jgi:hypothetical protein
MDVADGGTDHLVIIGVDIFEQKIDQAPIPLENGQDAEIGPLRRLVENRFQARGEIRVGERIPKGSKGKDKAVQRRLLFRGPLRRIRLRAFSLTLNTRLGNDRGRDITERK